MGLPWVSTTDNEQISVALIMGRYPYHSSCQSYGLSYGFSDEFLDPGSEED